MSQNQLVTAARDAMENIIDQYDVEPPLGEEYIYSIGQISDDVYMAVEGEETNYTISAWADDDTEGVYVTGQNFVDYDVGFPDRTIRVHTSPEPLELHSEDEVRDAVDSFYQTVSTVTEDNLQNEELSWSAKIDEEQYRS